MAQMMHQYYVQRAGVSPLTASLAWALLRPRDDFTTAAACWWIACKFEETAFDDSPWKVVGVFPLVGSPRKLCAAERAVLARTNFHIPYRTRIRALYEALGPGYDAWLFALIESGVVHLYTAERWSDILAAAARRVLFMPVLQVVLFAVRRTTRKRLPPRSPLLTHKRKREE